MNKIISLFSVLVSTFFCCAGALAFTKDDYRGHLQLAETTLIITEVVAGLDVVAWEIAPSSDQWLWFTQQSGTVSRLHPETREIQQLLRVPDVYYKKSFGLLGMALHPDFANKPYVFLHYTYRTSPPAAAEVIRSRLVRYRFAKGKLGEPVVLLDNLPGAGYHNGSRILVADDDTLFLTTGDVGEPEHSQQLNHLTGKVLRLGIDGSIPASNPFRKQGHPAHLIWSYGFRNSQGLALAANGKLYGADHGPNNDDEINLLLPGRNYGWPQIAGYCDLADEKRFCSKENIVEPLVAWTPTIAVAGLDYFNHAKVPEWQHSLVSANLKGRALRVLKLNDAGTAITAQHIYLQQQFGRLRDLAVMENGDIYLATSNTDWHPRYQPWMYDSLPGGGDRILRLRAAGPRELEQLAEIKNPIRLTEDKKPMALAAEDWTFDASDEVTALGGKLYQKHCVQCHGPEGQGAADLIPPLAGTDWVTGDRSRLIQVLLRGLSEPIVVKGKSYDQEMPAFAQLSDQHLAAILTYIRASFGNSANAILEGEIFEERKVNRPIELRR